MPSLYDLIMTDEPGAQEQARAMAEALRGQRRVAELAMLIGTGNKALGAYGQTMFGDAGKQEAQLGEAAGTRLQEALRRQQMTNEEAYRKGTLGIQRDELALHRDQLKQQAELAGLKATGEAKEAAEKSADDLRKEFQGQQGYKDFQTVNQAYRKILSTSPTGAGDISLVYGYMKLLDPGSTVREGEFATAANAGSAFQKIGLLYNKVINGEKLPDAVRQQFKSEAGKVFQAQTDQFKSIAEPYRQYALKRGINPTDVLFGETLKETPQPQPPGGAIDLRKKYGL